MSAGVHACARTSIPVQMHMRPLPSPPQATLPCLSQGAPVPCFVRVPAACRGKDKTSSDVANGESSQALVDRNVLESMISPYIYIYIFIYLFIMYLTICRLSKEGMVALHASRGQDLRYNALCCPVGPVVRRQPLPMALKKQASHVKSQSASRQLVSCMALHSLPTYLFSACHT